MDISIHAPREGGDKKYEVRYLSQQPPGGGATPYKSKYVKRLFDFNPRPPRGGRHIDIPNRHTDDSISIHAPREGGDSKDAQFYL